MNRIVVSPFLVPNRGPGGLDRVRTLALLSRRNAAGSIDRRAEILAASKTNCSKRRRKRPARGAKPLLEEDVSRLE
jgi:hypothetical protein